MRSVIEQLIQPRFHLRDRHAAWQEHIRHEAIDLAQDLLGHAVSDYAVRRGRIWRPGDLKSRLWVVAAHQHVEQRSHGLDAIDWSRDWPNLLRKGCGTQNRQTKREKRQGVFHSVLTPSGVVVSLAAGR
jgi:hypothetical protein